MQRERENFNFFSSPFGGMMSSSIFGGKDPFDGPFFSSPFRDLSQTSRLHQRAPPNDDDMQHVAKSNGGPVIQEIVDLDDEEDVDVGSKKKKDKAYYANRNPLVEHPDDQTDDHNKSVNEDVAHRVNDMKLEGTESKTQSVSYRRVTYGGINGAYYTSTTTRKISGSDGMVLEENKQADKTTGQATHRISRGIHDKGHSLTRKLASDGEVDTVQTLHNLEEEDLAGFEQKWNGNADRHLPGWKSGFDFHPNAGTSINWLTNWNTGLRDPFSRLRPTNSSTQPGTQSGRPKKVVRINIE